MVKILGTVVLFFTLIAGAYGQVDDAEIVFDSETYNFGTVEFGNQKINATFIFTNNSPIDFTIKDVKASCGCTVPSWPENPIKPGHKGVITATFDPTNLAGEVDKTIEIFANYNVIMSKIVRIKGIIKEPVVQDRSIIYPGQYGYIRQSKNIIPLGNIVNTQSYSRVVVFYNDYNLPLKLSGIEKKPDYITCDFSKTTLAPGDTASVRMTLTGREVNDYGLINAEVVFRTNDKAFPLKAVKFAFNMQEDFESWTKKQKKNAPKIEVSQTEFSFGRMKEGAKSEQKLQIRNNGKSPLRIMKVETHCGCTTIDLEKSEIAPGETKSVKITFDSMYVSGEAQKEVTIYTNDPEKHVVKLFVNATVLEN